MNFSSLDLFNKTCQLHLSISDSLLLNSFENLDQFCHHWKINFISTTKTLVTCKNPDLYLLAITETNGNFANLISFAPDKIINHLPSEQNDFRHLQLHRAEKQGTRDHERYPALFRDKISPQQVCKILKAVSRITQYVN